MSEDKTRKTITDAELEAELRETLAEAVERHGAIPPGYAHAAATLLLVGAVRDNGIRNLVDKIGDVSEIVNDQMATILAGSTTPAVAAHYQGLFPEGNRAPEPTDEEPKPEGDGA